MGIGRVNHLFHLGSGTKMYIPKQLLCKPYLTPIFLLVFTRKLTRLCRIISELWLRANAWNACEKNFSGDQFTITTQLKRLVCLSIPPLMQHHSCLGKFPPSSPTLVLVQFHLEFLCLRMWIFKLVNKNSCQKIPAQFQNSNKSFVREQI